MTAVADRPAGAEDAQREPAPPPPPHRLLGRFSTGHLLMLLAAAVAAVANYAALTGGEARTPVLIADASITAGDQLDADTLSTAEVDAASPLAEPLIAASERDRFDGTVATASLEAGEPLRRSDVQPAAAPDGQRAMSVPVDARHAVGGALRSGDRVDVVETADGEASYLVTDAQVLAVSEDGSLDGLTSFSVTVAVDAHEALRLAEAVHERELDVVRATGAAPADEPATSGEAATP